MRALLEAFQMAGIVLFVGIIVGFIAATAHAFGANDVKTCRWETTVIGIQEVTCR